MDKKTIINKLRKYASNIYDGKQKICNIIIDVNKDFDWRGYDIHTLAVDYTEMIVYNKNDRDIQMTVYAYVSAVIDNDFETIKTLFVKKQKKPIAESIISLESEYEGVVYDFCERIYNSLAEENALCANVGDVILSEGVYSKVISISYNYKPSMNAICITYNCNTCDKNGKLRARSRIVTANETIRIGNNRIYSANNIKKVIRS